jgi:hypothetical protein
MTFLTFFIIMLLMAFLISRLFVYLLGKRIKSVNVYLFANGLSWISVAFIWAAWNSRNPFTWVDTTLMINIFMPQAIWLIIDLYRATKKVTMKKTH